MERGSKKRDSRRIDLALSLAASGGPGLELHGAVAALQDWSPRGQVAHEAFGEQHQGPGRRCAAKRAGLGARRRSCASGARDAESRRIPPRPRPLTFLLGCLCAYLRGSAAPQSTHSSATSASSSATSSTARRSASRSTSSATRPARWVKAAYRTAPNGKPRLDRTPTGRAVERPLCLRAVRRRSSRCRRRKPWLAAPRCWAVRRVSVSGGRQLRVGGLRWPPWERSNEGLVSLLRAQRSSSSVSVSACSSSSMRAKR